LECGLKIATDMPAAPIENPIDQLCATAQETCEVARRIAQSLRGGDFFSLEGPLGAGKTAFVKGLAEGLGCAPDAVSSPTFTLVHEYGGGRLPLVHMDLYRLESVDELAALGFDDLAESSNVLAIEWGDKFPAVLPPQARRLVFSIEGEARRIRERI
jgi:tRNA threonylcarbamoyladenosine biosynthesis protein TsaE